MHRTVEDLCEKSLSLLLVFSSLHGSSLAKILSKEYFSEGEGYTVTLFQISLDQISKPNVKVILDLC